MKERHYEIEEIVEITEKTIAFPKAFEEHMQKCQSCASHWKEIVKCLCWRHLQGEESP